MTYPDAYTKLSDMRARLSSTFGAPGEPGYTAIYRTADGRRFQLDNGPWHGTGQEWNIKELDR